MINYNEIYSSEEEVLNELKKRWNDADLDKKLRAFLGDNIPEPFMIAPRAVISRHISTPDNEFMAFYEKSKKINLRGISFEYPGDKFTTTNHGKACLAKMVFYRGKDKNGNDLTEKKYSIEIGNGINENKISKEIKTLWGENFVDFHHRIFKKKYDTEIFDASDWFIKMGSKAKDYYPYYIALLTIKNVLFENIEEGRDDVFFTEIFLPALNYVKEQFNLKPLIMPIIPQDDLSNIYWWCYPENVLGDIIEV
jgi:hypothetical protein